MPVIGAWAESQAHPGKHGAWWTYQDPVTSEEEAYALIVSPGVGDGFGWEVWGPRGELAAPRIDSGQAITLDAAQAAAGTLRWHRCAG